MTIACNLSAIAPADRPRYTGLVSRLRAAIQMRTEIPDGYLYKLDPRALSRQELEEWISLERLCCPFLTLQLDEDQHLSVTGPAGVKELLAAEFPAPVVNGTT